MTLEVERRAVFVNKMEEPYEFVKGGSGFQRALKRAPDPWHFLFPCSLQDLVSRCNEPADATRSPSLKVRGFSGPFYYRALPSSKNPHFQNEARCTAFLWKPVLFAWEWKMISLSKAEHLNSFWNRGSGELGNGLIVIFWMGIVSVMTTIVIQSWT